jgi:hypothetical protein
VLTGAWLLFSFLLLLLFGFLLLVEGISNLELAVFLLVWLVPTYLLFRQWRRALWQPIRERRSLF